MVRPWCRAGGALALLALCLLPVAGADEGWDDRFGAVTAATALGSAFAVHGGQLAWASWSGSGVELSVTDLASRDTRIVTTIVAPEGSSLRMRDLSFDGRWIAWCDDRFGNYEAFALDTQSGMLRRLSEAGPDDIEAHLDGGRVAWSRNGRLWMHDLGNGTTWQPAIGPGQARDPAVSGDTLAWIRIDGNQRYLVASWAGAPAEDVARDNGSYVYNLRSGGGVMAWEARVLKDRNQPDLGFSHTVVQALRVSDRAVLNLSTVQDYAAGQGGPVGVAAGGGRVAWFDPAPGVAVRWWGPEGEGGPLDVRARSLALSEEYLVATEAYNSLGELRAMPWEEPERSSWLAPGPSPALLLVAVAAALAVAARR